MLEATFSVGVSVQGLAAGEAAALLNKLTFDEELCQQMLCQTLLATVVEDFVARQRQQQGTKQIRGPEAYTILH